jgi:hypothetical protein
VESKAKDEEALEGWTWRVGGNEGLMWKEEADAEKGFIEREGGPSKLMFDRKETAWLSE